MLFLLSLVKVVVVVELSTSLPCFVVCGNDVGGDNTATSSSVDNKIDAVATDDVTAPPVAVIVGSTWAFDLESTDEFSSRGFGTITVDGAGKSGGGSFSFIRLRSLDGSSLKV